MLAVVKGLIVTCTCCVLGATLLADLVSSVELSCSGPFESGVNLGVKKKGGHSACPLAENVFRGPCSRTGHFLASTFLQVDAVDFYHRPTRQMVGILMGQLGNAVLGVAKALRADPGSSWRVFATWSLLRSCREPVFQGQIQFHSRVNRHRWLKLK